MHLLMAIEHSLTERTGLEQTKAQQDCVADASPDGGYDISLGSDALHQYCVDCHTDDDQECLEAKSKERTQVIVTHLPPLTIGHGGEGNRCDGRHEVDLNHSSVDNDEDTDGQCPADDGNEHGLEPKPE